MAEEQEDPPWYSPERATALRGKGCTPRPRERLWTLTKAGRRVDAELLFQGEAGVEVQLSHEGVMAYAHRFNLRAEAVADGERERARLLREGWTQPVAR